MTAFNILVVPSIILVLAALITALLRRASASLRHEVWAIGIFGAAFLPLALIFAPKWEIPVLKTTSPLVVERPSEGALLDHQTATASEPGFIVNASSAPQRSSIGVTQWI